MRSWLPLPAGSLRKSARDRLEFVAQLTEPTRTQGDRSERSFLM